MPGLLIAAPASAQGKTTVTLGLLRALTRKGVQVVSGKSGPDYIDPAFHAAATGAPCLTLDSWAASPEQLRARAAMRGGEALVVEGAMGLADGAAGEPAGGRGSALALAQALDLEVVLVVDAARMGQSIAAIVRGFDGFGGVPLAGVILNRVGSERHAAMLRTAIGQACPVLGILPRRADLELPSRHLGLVQATEQGDLEAVLDRAADWVAGGCDLDLLGKMAGGRSQAGATAPARLPPLGQRIAIARDQAFGFSYWHMLEDWRAQGAELSFFSPLADGGPGNHADAVFLPGGYPELHAGVLAEAGTFQDDLRAAAERGALIWGECGGYMVMGEGLVDADGVAHRMTGLLPLETSFAERMRHLGYRRLDCMAGPWIGPLMGHEFHYATTLRADGAPLFEARDAEGTRLLPMGLVQGRVMGSFAHVIEQGVR